MLAKRIIPCLDVLGGRVVKGENFIGLKDAGGIAGLAAKYSGEGADELVFLDIAASGERRLAKGGWIKKAASALNIPFTVGGGISGIGQIREILRMGADKISLNTAAINNPSLVRDASEKFGAQCVVVAIDARNENGAWRVYSYGGKVSTGLDALAWAKQCEKLGAGEILLTSIDRDGTGKGFDCELTGQVAGIVGIPVIASGGAGSPRDFLDVFTKGKADAALAAGIFHYGSIRIGEVKGYLCDNGVGVRLEK
ncbi:imidazole glycerol phosphate synthase subunit HisF [Candidatus Micrarchaeota archaeon]|nr:imidazole glycerol phosphate synthase subunit HisF [Candidatus Micrarchaeota archaeon]